MRRAGLLVLPCALVGACLWTGEDAPPEPPPAPKGMVVATPVPLEPMVWPFYTASATSDVVSNVVMPMFSFRFAGAGLVFDPLFAQAWAWSDDGKWMSVVLRRDVTWSDGRPVTASDVAYTWEILRDPAANAPRGNIANQLSVDPASGWPQNPTAIADDVLLFRFQEAGSHASQLLLASTPPTPRHALQGSPAEALRTHPQTTNPLASGPFRFAAPATPESFVLEPNPYGPAWAKPNLDRVEFHVVPDESTRLSLFTQGQADLVFGAAPSAAATAAAQRPGSQIIDRGRRSLDYLVLNPTTPALQTAEARSAIASMLDIDRLMHDLWNAFDEPHAQRARGVICPSLLPDDALPLPPPPDIARAHATLAALGWADHNGDHRLDRDGTDLTLHLLYKDASQARDDLAVAMQQQLGDAGIQLVLDKVTADDHKKRLLEGSFEITLLGLNAGLAINPAGFLSENHKRTTSNPTAFFDEDLAERLSRGLHEPDPARAAEIWLEFQRQHLAKAPIIPLWWRGELALLAPGFQGAQIDMVSTLHDLHLWQAP